MDTSDNVVERRSVSRRAFVAGAASVGVAAWARRAAAQPKATITYWNGLTGADGKVMDELIDQFTRDSGVRIEQQRLPWADLYAKLQVAVPAGEGPDLALIHTVEVPHFASDGVLEAIDDATTAAKGFRGEDYLPATWQGGTFQGNRYSLPLDVPQHIMYLNVKVMKDAGLVGADGRPRVPGSRDELVTMAKRITKADTFRLGMWIAGSWNFSGLREAKVDFVAVPVPRLFKQAVVWAMPHQYSFPKPKGAADRARRDAAWAHVRWMTDNVAEWTLKAGQVSASRKAHADPRITGDPVLRALLAQAPNWQVGQPTPKWVAAENITRPVIEAIYTGQKPAKAAMEDLARQINALPD